MNVGGITNKMTGYEDSKILTSCDHLSLFTNRKRNKDWLWEELIKLTIKERGLKGDQELKFRENPNYFWLKSTATKLIPDSDSDNFTIPKTGQPPTHKLRNVKYYEPPRVKAPRPKTKAESQ